MNVEIVIEAIDKASRPIGKIQQKLASLGAGFGKLGAIAKVAVPIAIGSVLVGAVYKGVKSFTEFEDALADVRKTTNMSKKDVMKLGKAIDDMAKKMPVSQKELANIAAIAGQLGIQGKKNIMIFTKMVAKASVAFDMSAEETATALAKLANIYNIPISQVDRLASAIDQLGNTTAAKEEEIIRAMYQIGASGAQLGATQQQIAAMSATLISLGMQPERAGTRLQSAFNQMTNNLDKMASDMGITVEELKKRFAKDFYGTLMNYITVLSKKYPNKMDFLNRANKVFGVIGSKAILSLASAHKQLTKNLNTAISAYNKNIALQREYANKTDTLAASLKILKNSLYSVYVKIGSKLAPAIKGLANAIETYILPAISDLIDWLGKMWTNISNSAAFKAFVTFLKSKVFPVLSTFYEWIRKLAGLFVSPDWEKIGKHIGKGLTGAETAIGGAFSWIYKQIAGLKETLINLPFEIFNAINNGIKSFADNLGNTFDNLWKYATNTKAIDKMTSEWADKLLSGTAGITQILSDMFKRGTKEAKDSGFFGNLIRLFINLFKVLGIIVVTGLETIGYLIKNLLLKIYPGIRNILIEILAKIGKLFGDALSWIYNNIIVAFVQKVIDAINFARSLVHLEPIQMPNWLRKIDLGSVIEARILGWKGGSIENNINITINTTGGDEKKIAKAVSHEVSKQLAKTYSVRRGGT